ncbi:hypothetical protein VTN00DRAFT_8619 [Thermoascus crustaceus]|uniref:uncharacterized protein n=1 Tax=Thermoascus crustaceus TaxID=5088 RepID=UPI0037423F9C
MLKRSALNILVALEHQQGNGRNENFIENYERYLERHLIPRCYLAFSTVVADGQFSTLGIVLLAVLSRLAKLIGVRTKDSQYSFKGDVVTLPDIATANSEDLGEVVRRKSDPLASVAEPNPQEPPNPGIRIEKISKRTKHQFEGPVPGVTALPEDNKDTKRSKKRRKANAIDDLFNTVL